MKTTGELRINEATEKKLKTLKETTDLKEALDLLVDIGEKHVYYERQIITGYDSKTGKPCKYEWEPTSDSDANGCRLKKFEPKKYLDDKITNILEKNGSIALKRGNDLWIVEYEQEYSDMCRDGYPYRMGPYIHLKKGKLLEKIIGGN